MKNEELLQDAIGMIGDDLIADADYIDDTDRRPRRPRIIRWSAVACACLAVIVAVSVGWLWRGDEPGVEPPDVAPPIVDVIPQNCVIVTSWEELKALYEAAQISEEKLIETERRMERYCDHYSDSFGLFLNRDPNFAKADDAFLDIYGKAKEDSILVPLDFSVMQLEEITVWYKGKTVRLSSGYRIPYGELGFDLSLWPADNYADEMALLEEDPLARVEADGYYADVWSFRDDWGDEYWLAYLTVDGDHYPRFGVKMMTPYTAQKDIPQEFISLLGQFRITTVQEMVDNAETMDLPELPKFNVISEYQSAGKSLVDPVFVSEDEFLLTYPFVEGYSVLLNIFWPRTDYRSEYEVRYRFDYAIDPDTNEIDRSKLVNGVSMHLKDGKVGQMLCISKEGPALEYFFFCDAVVVENFDGIDVELYDLSKDGQPRYYAVFQIGEYYITYATYGGEQYHMILCVDWFVREARYYDLIPED